ncbi:HAD family hydrolase [Halonatronum saccharophilum]|uniref:HAD family hydrolase n=1 Tax=Halonatronum saccharophilum TaxID=150060 RepID=UPI0004B01B80|nr:HAD family phosphatase [Halonatronum saccharophilum]
MEKLEAVIFDMDGVIIDSEPIYFEIERRLFNALNLDLSQKEHQSFVGMTIKGLWKEIKKKYPINHSIKELSQIHKDEIFSYMSNAEKLPLVVGINKLIEEISKEGLKMAVASSSPKRLIEIILDKLKLDKSFDLLISGEEVMHGKPSPDIFLYTADKLRVKPTNSIIIEDSANGVRAAKTAKMKCIGFQNLNSGKQDLSPADIIVDSIDEVNIKVLEGLFAR